MFRRLEYVTEERRFTTSLALVSIQTVSDSLDMFIYQETRENGHWKWLPLNVLGLDFCIRATCLSPF